MNQNQGLRNSFVFLIGVLTITFLLMLALVYFIQSEKEKLKSKTPEYFAQIIMKENIRIDDYFDFIDSIVVEYDSLTPYPLSEHLLVRANPFLIEAFANTDYYLQMKEGYFIYDNREVVVLKKRDSIVVPSLGQAAEIIEKQNNTEIDINIPEYKLRIIENADTIFTFPVRVGQNRVRYLATAGRDEDLRTKTGIGEIYSVNRNPSFYNPVDGEEFFVTRRDDNKVTAMPRIPWLHPIIDCHLWGQMIHPTSNPKSLGKAYSNGCIGTSEAAAWYIYFYAPIRTKVTVRYDLEMIDSTGKEYELNDIYGKGNSVELVEVTGCDLVK